jgi:hypothetical protein
MSEDVQDATNETPVEETAAEAPVEGATESTDDVVAEAVTEDEAPAAEVVEEAPADSAAFGPVRVARVFVCERGHRTTTLWGEPDICAAKPFRSGAECGMKLYHITELPEQVQKALNPLKASKKASKKK